MKINICVTCSTEFITSRTARFCGTCTLDRRRQATREFMRRQRQQKPDHVSIIKKCSRYGITAEAYIGMLEAQAYRCACCPAEINARNAYVDHDHACCSGVNLRACSRCVRGLLCLRCNSALGMAQDSIEVLRNLTAYLETHAIRLSVAS